MSYGDITECPLGEGTLQVSYAPDNTTLSRRSRDLEQDPPSGSRSRHAETGRDGGVPCVLHEPDETVVVCALLALRSHPRMVRYRARLARKWRGLGRVIVTRTRTECAECRGAQLRGFLDL